MKERKETCKEERKKRKDTQFLENLSNYSNAGSEKIVQ